MLSGKAKANIESHCIELGRRGLPWTILRPGFFLENFNDFIGSISASVMKKGLKPDTEVGFIATADIGKVAAGVFRVSRPPFQTPPELRIDQQSSNRTTNASATKSLQ